MIILFSTFIASNTRPTVLLFILFFIPRIIFIIFSRHTFDLARDNKYTIKSKQITGVHTYLTYLGTQRDTTAAGQLVPL